MVAIQQRTSSTRDGLCTTRRKKPIQWMISKVWLILSIVLCVMLMIVLNLHWVLFVAPIPVDLSTTTALDQKKEHEGNHHQQLLSTTNVIPLPPPKPASSTSTTTQSIDDNRNLNKKQQQQQQQQQQQTEYAIFNETELTTAFVDRKRNNKKSIVPVLETDFIYSKYGWNSAPVIIHSHKLIFFTVQKAGCTVFKQLMRRMMHYKNWRTKDPANPKTNGLKYLVSFCLFVVNDLFNFLCFTT